VTRTAGASNVLTNGSTSISNPSVAENNSPIPEDRVYFRYNYFNNALSVTGISAQTIPSGQGTFVQLPDTKSYDVFQYTFGAEKTFCNGRMSVEVRVPFQTGLASDNTLSYGSIVGPVPGTDANGNPLFQVNPTPQNTLGHEDTEFGDMTIIWKALICQQSGLAVSGGTAFGIPTAHDTHVRVIDFAGTQSSLVDSSERQRDFAITNNSWSLSPFLAVLATPTDRLFAQGFMQFDFPISANKVRYTDQQILGVGTPSNDPLTTSLLASGQYKLPPYTAVDHLSDQILMHMDAGFGYWVMRDPSAHWITGIAPTGEIHYTTTLSDAKIVTLPGNGIYQQIDPKNPRNLIPEIPPQVGNQRGRVDILDLTVGTTVEIANRTTLAAGFAFPVKGGDNKVFEWEFQLQLNYYFGGPARRSPAPTLY
jgi:hypothetical protein